MTHSGGQRTDDTLQEVQDRTVEHHEQGGLIHGQVCLLSLLPPLHVILGCRFFEYGGISRRKYTWMYILAVYVTGPPELRCLHYSVNTTSESAPTRGVPVENQMSNARNIQRWCKVLHTHPLGVPFRFA